MIPLVWKRSVPASHLIHKCCLGCLDRFTVCIQRYKGHKGLVLWVIPLDVIKWMTLLQEIWLYELFHLGDQLRSYTLLFSYALHAL